MNMNGINFPIRIQRTAYEGQNPQIQLVRGKTGLKVHTKFTWQSKPKGQRSKDIIVQIKVKLMLQALAPKRFIL